MKTSKLNLFLDLSTVSSFLEKHREIASQDIFVECSYTIDIIDAPQRLFYQADSEHAELVVNRRIPMYQVEENESFRDGRLVLNRKGEVEGNAADGLHEVMQFYLVFSTNLASWLREHGAFERYADLNPSTQGILVSMNDGSLEMKLVSGDERPDLVCRMLSGETKRMRPYDSDVMCDVLFDAMPLERKEAAAEAGDVAVMKHLFALFMGSNDSAHKDLERNTRKLLNVLKTASGEENQTPEEDEKPEDTRNPEKAFYWLKKLAETGDIEASKLLSKFYAIGFGCERSFVLAVQCLKDLPEEDIEQEPIEFYNECIEVFEKAKAGDSDAQCDYASKLAMLGRFAADLGQDKDYAEAFQWAKKAAAQNSLEGMSVLTVFYQNGVGVPKDDKKAFRLCERAAQKGHVESQERLARMYLEGTGTEKNLNAAAEWAEKAAEQDDPWAMKTLARIYLDEDNTERNPVAAMKWLEKAADLGDDEALQLMEHLETTVSPSVETEDSESFIKTKKAAEQGDPHAKAQLAEKYLGISQTPDGDQREGQRKAFETAKETADQGDSLGMFVLGACYENGYGVEADLEKAFQLYKQSAELGNPRGELSLSVAYLQGRGTDIDVDAAMDWLDKAEKHGNPEIEEAKTAFPQLMCLMGMDMLGDGAKSGRQDPALGTKLIQYAAKMDYDPAVYALGMMYLNGKGVERDLETGLELLKKSAANGNQHAVENLKKFDTPLVYHNAAYMEMKKRENADKEKAFRLMKHAIDSGFSGDYEMYGIMLLSGYGAKPDYDGAVEWLQKAEKNGEEKAADRLRKCQTPDGLFRAARALINYSRKQNIENSPEALAMLQRAAEAGSAEAYNVMAGIYAAPGKAAKSFRIIVEKDTHKAREYLEKAIALEPGLEHLRNNLQKLTEEENDGHSELKWKFDLDLKRDKGFAAAQPSDTTAPAEAKPAKEEQPSAYPDKPAEPSVEPQPKPETEEEKQARLSREYREKGLCRYCGGEFKKGLFSTKCTRCGKKKDY